METSAAPIKYYLKHSYVAQYNINETIIFYDLIRHLIEFSGKSFRYIGRPNQLLVDKVINEGTRIPEDAVNKIIAQSRLLSSTLSPYMRNNQLVMVTPFDDEEGRNGTYQLVQSNDGIISIYWHNDMSLDNWSHFYDETVIHSYDVTLSKRITNALETYKKIFNELVEKYAHR